MSISETGGVIANRDSFNASGLQTSAQSVPVSSQTLTAGQSMSLAYTADGTAVYKPISDPSPHYMSTGEGSAGGSAVHDLGVNHGEPMKRKRGRPRKYSSAGGGSTMPMHIVPVSAASPNPSIATVAQPPSAGTPLLPGAPSSPAKKARGRPPGSRTKQRDSMGSVGSGFTPHVISVSTGEDVSAKILSFSQQGPRAICILSATGAVSNVTLRQAATSGGTATYEGCFDILCLSGSFLPSEVGGQPSRTGGISVSLAGQDGRLLGGCVAGLLTAASPVQVILSSFIPDGQKESSKPLNDVDHFSAPLNVNPVGRTGTSSPPSHGTVSESSGGPSWPWQPTQAQ